MEDWKWSAKWYENEPVSKNDEPKASEWVSEEWNVWKAQLDLSERGNNNPAERVRFLSIFFYIFYGLPIDVDTVTVW